MKLITEQEYKKAENTIKEYFDQRFQVKLVKRRKNWWSDDMDKNTILIARMATPKDVYECFDNDEQTKYSTDHHKYFIIRDPRDDWDGILYKSDVEVIKRIK